MNDYKKRVREEARTFYDAAIGEFEQDEGEHGGRSEQPNLARWIDRTGKLSERVREISSGWSHKDILWVRNNTRNRPKDGGGDPKSAAFASFLQDVKHEIKKLVKSRRKG